MLLLRRRVGTRRREGSGSREEEGGAEAEMEEAAEECHQLPGILSAAKHSKSWDSADREGEWMSVRRELDVWFGLTKFSTFFEAPHVIL